MQKIGVIGCGLMGYGMTKNLLSKGYEVTVYDKVLDSVKRATDEGAGRRDSTAVAELLARAIRS